MSTENGKLEVVSIIDDEGQDFTTKGICDDPSEVCKQSAPGLVVFKIIRSPGSGETQGQLVLAKRNPTALWISDYEDRIVLDGRKGGQFSDARAEAR
jgi:hypothetical protein